MGVEEEEIAGVAGLCLGVGAFGFSLRHSQWDTDFRGEIIYVPVTRMLYGTRVSAALNVCFRPKTVIRGVDLQSIEDTAVIELLLTRPERKVER